MSNLGLRMVRAQAHYSASRFHEDGVDLNVSHAEFAALIEQVKADAWDKAIEHVSQIEADVGFMEHYKRHNPYRKQEEAR